MKSVFYWVLLLVFSIAMMIFSGCYENGDNPDFPVYSYLDPVNNPPDIFQIVYNISYNGDKPAYVTFEDDAVWLIEKLGDSRIDYWVINDTSTWTLFSADTIALKAGFTYIFVANNNNYDDFTNFFTMFTKLDYDYDSFEPKF